MSKAHSALSFRERLWNRAADASKSCRQDCAEIGAEADAEIARLKTIEQPAAVPVARVFVDGDDWDFFKNTPDTELPDGEYLLYTAPPGATKGE